MKAIGMAVLGAAATLALSAQAADAPAPGAQPAAGRAGGTAGAGAGRVPAPPAPVVENRSATVTTYSLAFPNQTRAPVLRSNVSYQAVPFATGLANTWGAAVLPDGRLIVTERPGRVRLVGADGKISEPMTGVPAVLARGLGGLHDVVLDPAFARNRRVYLTFNEQRPEGLAGLSVFRGVLKADGSGFDEGVVIFRAGPGAPRQGEVAGRMLFDRSGALLVAAGEYAATSQALQQLDNHLGKILRINTDGGSARGNPIWRTAGAKPEIFAMGLRDPQGLTFDSRGRLWVMDHGPRGGDEVSLVQGGKNYGWPLINYGAADTGRTLDGSTAKPGLEQPVYFWDPAIGASGLTYYDGRMFPAWRGDLLGASLAQKHVTRLVIRNDRVVGEERLFTELNQRIRNVVIAPDGALYLLTDVANGAIYKVTAKP